MGIRHSWLAEYGVHEDINQALDGVKPWDDLTSKFWSGVRDRVGKDRNPHYYEGMWEKAWEEYIILASQILKEKD